MQQAIYMPNKIIINNKQYDPILPDNLIPVMGDIVYGFIEDNNFHIIKKTSTPAYSYINPLNKFSLSTGRSDIRDFIDGDRFLLSNGMFFGALGDMLMAKASEKANITMFKDENLVRIVGQNRQDFAQTYSMQSFGDDITYKIFDGNPLESIKILMAKQGDGIDLYIQDNDPISTTPGKCLSNIKINKTGEISMTTTKSVLIGKTDSIDYPLFKNNSLISNKNKKNKYFNYFGYEGGSNLTDDLNTNTRKNNQEVEAKNAGWAFRENILNKTSMSMIFMREDGSLILRGPKGSFIELNSNGDINLSSASKMNLTASESINSLSLETNIRSKGNIGITSDEKNINIYAGRKISAYSKIISLESLLSTDIKSDADISIKSSANVDISGFLTATINSGLLSLYSTVPMILANLAFTNLDFNGPWPITNKIPAIPPPLPDPFSFTFDPDKKMNSLGIFIPIWMQYHKEKLQTWNLTNTRMIKNGTLPYPGIGATIIGFSENTRIFCAKSWKTKIKIPLK